jgi:acyl carrier protein
MEQKQNDSYPVSEEVLCALFCEVLELERVDTKDDFFDLGGDSLTATRLISRIRSRFNVEISIEVLFEAPSVSQMVPRLRDFVAARTMRLDGKEQGSSL